MKGMEAKMFFMQLLKWPIKYPYWCTGESVDAFVIVAYAENVEQIKGLWPEAYMIECEEVNEITFTTRFPKPKWYNSSSNC